MKYSEIEEMVVDVNDNGKETGFDFEPESCPQCGSNQYDVEFGCLTCEEEDSQNIKSWKK